MLRVFDIFATQGSLQDAYRRHLDALSSSAVSGSRGIESDAGSSTSTEFPVELLIAVFRIVFLPVVVLASL